jgi:hypothetical protein
MTEVRGRIASVVEKARLVAPKNIVLRVMLPLALLGAGCNDPPPEAPTAPVGIRPSYEIGGGLEDEPVEPGIGRPDYWSETYGAYMTPELKREYLATPEDERFEQFGLRLLDFELREQLLLAHQEDLTREEKDAYRRLPDADACRRFVLARGAAPVTTNTRR